MLTRQEALLRGITLCVAVLFVGLGLWFTLQPHAVEALYPMSLNAPMAISEIRAIFGGLMIGIGGSVLVLDLIYGRRRDAAMVLASVTAGLILARLVGLSGEGFPSGPVLNETIFEIVLLTLLVSLGAFHRTA